MKLVLLTEKTKSDLAVKEGRTTKCYARRLPKILVGSIVYTTRLNTDWLKFWNDGFSRENKYIFNVEKRIILTLQYVIKLVYDQYLLNV